MESVRPSSSALLSHPETRRCSTSIVTMATRKGELTFFIFLWTAIAKLLILNKKHWHFGFLDKIFNCQSKKFSKVMVKSCGRHNKTFSTIHWFSLNQPLDMKKALNVQSGHSLLLSLQETPTLCNKGLMRVSEYFRDDLDLGQHSWQCSDPRREEKHRGETEIGRVTQ